LNSPPHLEERVVRLVDLAVVRWVVLAVVVRLADLEVELGGVVRLADLEVVLQAVPVAVLPGVLLAVGLEVHLVEARKEDPSSRAAFLPAASFRAASFRAASFRAAFLPAASSLAASSLAASSPGRPSEVGPWVLQAEHPEL
jgi:hypothetical protein